MGIDLGTTFSAIAWLNPTGHVEVLQNSDGYAKTPSVVYFEGDAVIVGREAAKAALLRPDRAAECFKRDMGRAHCSRKVCGQQMRPETLSGIVLKKLKQDAEQQIGPIADAVITVPAYFDDTRRKATQDAAVIAGLHVCGILNEPTAAALCYGYGKHLGQDKERVILVYDLGGGTFDATLMRLSGDSNFTTIATDGDVMLGGKDWDRRLLDYVAGEFMRQVGTDPREDDVSYQELSLHVEECKITLSKRPTVTVPVTHAGRRLGVVVTRERFQELVADLLARTQSTLELLVAEAGLTWEQIDDILLVGGSSRMVAVGEMMKRVSGKEPSKALDPDLAVAKGAAVYGASLRLKQRPETPAFSEPVSRYLSGMTHHNVNSHSLGVAARNPRTNRHEHVILIRKNSPIPCQSSKVFGLGREDQRRVIVKVLEGEAPNPEACIQIGTCFIEDLPAGLPKGSPVEVTFSYSEDGRIHVEAVARAAARDASVQIVRPEGLDREGVEKQTQVLSTLQVM